MKNNKFFDLRFIQKENKKKTFYESIFIHFSHLEGFLLISLYLFIMWDYNLLSDNYYNHNKSIDIYNGCLFLLLLDFLQYISHFLLHKLIYINTYLYTISHRYHHKFLNPVFYKAYSGSILDTVLMIIIPLHITQKLISLNYFTYLLVGNIYSCWLTLLHFDFHHPWDKFFKKIGFGTPSYHHVHHKTYKYNYGHLFIYWDKIFGTYLDSNAIFKS